ncbi:MAG TPA: hypothetical protein VLB44_09305 [Kofleriaceae bacterium]|nr:hypothetical protein [Kofleriaceae bacterium]
MRLAVVVVSLLLGSVTRPATADGTRELGWRAPKGCPDARSMRARVEKRLDRSLDDVTVGVEVDVEKREGGYTATIDLRAVTVANDVRTLKSKRCGELADAVAVIVARVASDAIAQKQTAIIEMDPAEPAHEHEEERVDVIAPAAPAAPRPWALGARISGVSGIGVIPKVGLGGELAVTLRVHDTLAEVAATRWATSVAQFHDGAPAKVAVELDAASARYGWRPARMPLRAWLAVETGSMRGTGIVLPNQQLESGRWLAAGAGFGIAWQMRPWIRLVGATETLVALERVRFSMGDGIVVYAPSPMSFRTICGLEVGWQ